MTEGLEFVEFNMNNRKDQAKVRYFLYSCGLIYEPMNSYVALTCDEEIIAGGGMDGNVIKCVAVTESAREQSLINGLITYIRRTIEQEGYDNAFVFTKPSYERIFHSLAFYCIGRSDNAVLLESHKGAVERYCKSLSRYRKEGVSGAVVVNCNPITKGHLYLIEQAALQVDNLHLFVVQTDRSFFRFDDRYRLVCEATKHIPNLTVHKGGDYIISAATFPAYFIKSADEVSKAQIQLDLNVFARHIAPALRITKRFVGSEKNKLLADYNKQMKSELKNCGIERVEIKRLQLDKEDISASRVRALFEKRDKQGIYPLVPECTYQFLCSLMDKYE